MSSHHVVKDKQEPALLIANGAECSYDLMAELLEWSPFIMVLDGAITSVMKLGIKVDVLLGDFDRNELPLEEIKEAQYPIEIIHTPDQDKTDLEKGIEFLIEKGFPSVNILWATGKRMDHTLSNIFSLVKYKSSIQMVIMDDHSKIIALKEQPASFEKWYKAGTAISLIPLPEAQGVKTRNLLYPLNDEKLSLGIRIGNSNETLKDGLVSVEFQRGELLLLECID